MWHRILVKDHLHPLEVQFLHAPLQRIENIVNDLVVNVGVLVGGGWIVFAVSGFRGLPGGLLHAWEGGCGRPNGRQEGQARDAAN